MRKEGTICRKIRRRAVSRPGGFSTDFPVFVESGADTAEHIQHAPQSKKSAGTYLSSQAVSSQVFSARPSLTAVFGMGTGGTSASSAPAIYAQHTSLTYSLYPRDAPSKLNNKLRQIRSTIKTCGQALDLLVHASSTCHHAYTLCLSTL